MKYKVGDKVKIKTWKQMEKEFEKNSTGSISCSKDFPESMERDLNEIFPNRIVTIKKVYNDYYEVEGMRCLWSDDMIECSAEEYKEPVYEPVLNRFEIMDLGE